MGTRQEVIFRLDQEEFGLEIMKVHSIEKYQEIVKIPNTPSYIEGIINLRGEVHPIFNLRKKFHLPEKEVDQDTKIIIVNANDMTVGFIVDSVAEILHIDEEQIEPAPKLITGVNRKYITSVAKINDRMVILLDVDLILDEEEQEEMNSIINE